VKKFRIHFVIDTGPGGRPINGSSTGTSPHPLDTSREHWDSTAADIRATLDQQGGHPAGRISIWKVEPA
jgi:hypothetical protein